MRSLIASESFDPDSHAQPKALALNGQISQVLRVAHLFVLPIVERFPLTLHLKLRRHHRKKFILTRPFAGHGIGHANKRHSSFDEFERDAFNAIEK